MFSFHKSVFARVLKVISVSHIGGWGFDSDSQSRYSKKKKKVHLAPLEFEGETLTEHDSDHILASSVQYYGKYGHSHHIMYVLPSA